MDYKLDDSHNKYIKITITGVLEKKSLLKVMHQLITHPDYSKKHSLWDFTQASMGINILDLKEIVGFLRLYKPKEKKFANKGAFLVSGDMNMAMVNIYITLSKLLPFKYGVFTEQIEAENFLTRAF